MIKHYHSLAPLGQEARKPVFLLRSADGAIGAHQQAVRDAYGHFRELTERLLDVAGLGSSWAGLTASAGRRVRSRPGSSSFPGC